MHSQRRLISVLLTVIMVALIILGSNGKLTVKEPENPGEETAWTSQKETIYVWYADQNLESYMNSAAVSFGEAEGVRVIPVLKTTSTLLEDVYQATMDPEQKTPDAYVINNDELEQAYLSGLATEIQNTSGMVNEVWY
ncbi:MAG: hypothetical protein J5721_06200, partial [Lachnospiraceae bacterium]|nr:hypothetical protein [Lachnospiraceae bacterium]